MTNTQYTTLELRIQELEKRVTETNLLIARLADLVSDLARLCVR